MTTTAQPITDEYAEFAETPAGMLWLQTSPFEDIVDALLCVPLTSGNAQGDARAAAEMKAIYAHLNKPVAVPFNPDALESHIADAEAFAQTEAGRALVDAADCDA